MENVQYQSAVKHKLCTTELPINDVEQSVKRIKYHYGRLYKGVSAISRQKNEKRPKLQVMNVSIASAIKAKKQAFFNWKANGKPNLFNK